MTHCTCSKQVYSKKEMSREEEEEKVKEKEMGREEEEEKVVAEGREMEVAGERGRREEEEGVCDLSPT